DQKETYYLSYAFSNKSMLLYFEIDSQKKMVERYWDAGKGDWENKFPLPENDCDVYGKCGAFGSCDAKKPSICSCLRGFKPKNREEWNRENWTSGCVRTTPLQCQKVNSGSEVGKEHGFLKLEMMKVPAFPEWSSALKGNCEDQCLKNCSCVAYAYEAGIGYKKKDTSAVIIIVAMIGVIIIFTISTFFLWSWMAKYRGRKQKTKEKRLFNIGKSVEKCTIDNVVGENLIEVKLQQLPLFNFEELATATNNFHLTKELGEGGFGPVYRVIVHFQQIYYSLLNDFLLRC
ncbi:hypothetical protein SCA6_018065, partial [Theobroma cacao]